MNGEAASPVTVLNISILEGDIKDTVRTYSRIKVKRYGRHDRALQLSWGSREKARMVGIKVEDG